MHIKDAEFDKVIEQIEKFESRLYAHPLHETEDIDDVYSLYLEKDKVCLHINIINKQLNTVKFKYMILYQIDRELLKSKTELKKAKSLMQMDDLKCRKRILRRMGYCTAGEVIETKGRIACELSR